MAALQTYFFLAGALPFAGAAAGAFLAAGAAGFLAGALAGAALAALAIGVSIEEFPHNAEDSERLRDSILCERTSIIVAINFVDAMFPCLSLRRSPQDPTTRASGSPGRLTWLAGTETNA